MKRRLKIAVRALVEYVLRTGDLELEFMATTRSTEGIRAHQRVQRTRPDNYMPEVTVSHQIETERFILEIGGRIDGVYSAPASSKSGKVTIEEIKSTTRDLKSFDTVENPIHWGQVKCYAYIYGVEKHLDEIETRLTYCHLESGKTRELNRQYTIEELEADFNDLIARYLKWADHIAEWAEIRDKSIERLQFPFGEYRPGQRRMAVETFRTIKERGQMLVQAATGIGKTMAAIFPAVKAFPEELHQKIFYLTARTTGRGVAEKALGDLCTKGLCIKFLTLTAKDKICFNPEGRCTAEECEFAKGYYDRIDGALESLFSHDAFTRERIEQVSEVHRVCPFEFSLDLSLWVDCIICDYNYAFDPRVYLRRFFLYGNGDYTFLIDESHNLVDRSRDMFSAEITKQPFLDVRRAIKKDLPHIYRRMGRVNTWLVRARKECELSEDARSDESLPDDLLPILKRFLHDTEYWLSHNIRTPFREDLLDIYFSVTGFMRVAEQYDEHYVTCYEKLGRKDLRVKLFCMDPSEQMNQALKRCQAAVFFSATMTPQGYFQQIFGCDEAVRKLILPSPFPRENLGLFVADRVSTFYRERDKTKALVTAAIHELVNENKGNYLLYFPSYAYMKMIYASFSEMGPEMDTIIQTSGMAEDERDSFLERFSHDNPETLVGFAVMGGIFGEGIDLVGDRLSGVAVVGVGLPGISLENDLIRAYFSETDGTGFEYAYLYPGINRVLQAAGRVIRTDTDRGVVLLIDQRFATFRYRSLFPENWRPIKVRNETPLATALKTFWDDGGPDS